MPAVGSSSPDTAAAPLSSDMKMAQKDVSTLNDLYSQVMNDAKQMQSSGQNSYAPNTTIARDVNNAVRAGQQMQYDYFTPLNQMNAPAHQFVNAATDQLQMMQLGAESGRIDAGGMQTLAQNVTMALSALMPKAPAAPSASTAASAGTASPAATAVSTDSSSPAMTQVSRDLASEASATSTDGKASFVGSAISNLIQALGGTPSVSSAAAATAAPAVSPALAPAAAPASDGNAAPISKQLGTDVLNSLNQLSDLGNQSGAPGTLQDAIAKLVGMIQNMFRGSPAAPSAPAPQSAATPAAATPAPSPAQSSAIQRVTSQAGQGQNVALISLLQQLEGILGQVKPHLANTPKGNAAMDGLAKVIGEIAQSIQEQPPKGAIASVA